MDPRIDLFLSPLIGLLVLCGGCEVWAQNPGQPQPYSLCFARARTGLEMPAEGLSGNHARFEARVSFRLLERYRGRADLLHQEGTGEEGTSFRISYGPGEGILAEVTTAEGKKVRARTGKVRDRRWHTVSATWERGTLRLQLDEKVVAEEKGGSEEGQIAGSGRPVRVGPFIPERRKRDLPFPGFLRDVTVEAGPAEGGEPVVVQHDLQATFPQASLELESGATVVLPRALASWGWTIAAPEPDGQAPAVRQVQTHDFRVGALTGNAGTHPQGVPHAALVHARKLGRTGIVWQASDRTIGITWMLPQGEGFVTHELENIENGLLAAGTVDDKGQVYYLVVEERPRDANEGYDLGIEMRLADSEGKLLRRAVLDDAPAGFNVFDLDRRWRGSMAISKGQVGVHFSHRMWRGRDGLRHQRGAIFTVGQKDLQVSTPPRQASGHSFGNRMFVDGGGDFLCLDLGDNYPRGVHLHRFGRGRRTSRVIFTYKTLHGTRPFRGSPAYEEISGDGTTFYRWSNDNGTYSFLGGLAEMKRSYAVVFGTQRSPDGKVLDNARAVHGRDDPYDLVLLPIRKKFPSSRGEPNVVTDDVIAGDTPKERVETGGFYDFGGRWKEQRITGAVWLTNYTSGEAAVAPVIFAEERDTATVIWQKLARGREPDGAWMCRIDGRGRVVQEPVGFGQNLGLIRGATGLTVDGWHHVLGSRPDPETGRALLCLHLIPTVDP